MAYCIFGDKDIVFSRFDSAAKKWLDYWYAGGKTGEDDEFSERVMLVLMPVKGRLQSLWRANALKAIKGESIWDTMEFKSIIDTIVLEVKTCPYGAMKTTIVER
jgi:hypothetical protein